MEPIRRQTTTYITLCASRLGTESDPQLLFDYLASFTKWEQFADIGIPPEKLLSGIEICDFVEIHWGA